MANLATAPAGSGLGGLSAGVGVHLGVDDDDVAHFNAFIQRCSQPSADILAAGQHVVETAEADIIAPTVAAEDPLALLDEAVTELEELLADVKKSQWLFDSVSGEQRALLHQRDETVGDFLGLEKIIVGGKGNKIGRLAFMLAECLTNKIHTAMQIPQQIEAIGIARADKKVVRRHNICGGAALLVQRLGSRSAVIEINECGD